MVENSNYNGQGNIHAKEATIYQTININTENYANIVEIISYYENKYKEIIEDVKRLNQEINFYILIWSGIATATVISFITKDFNLSLIGSYIVLSIFSFVIFAGFFYYVFLLIKFKEKKKIKEKAKELIYELKQNKILLAKNYTNPREVLYKLDTIEINLQKLIKEGLQIGA